MLKSIRNQNGRFPAWIGLVVIVLALALIIWLIAKQARRTETVETGTGAAVAPTQQANETKAFVGTIRSINNQQLELFVPANRNGLSSDKVVTVLVDGNTVVTRKTLPRTLPADLDPVERQNLFKSEQVAAQDLKIGDDITVVSDINIASLEQFAAIKIEVRKVE